jgi:SAM-dependent methyltransferase
MLPARMTALTSQRRPIEGAMHLHADLVARYYNLLGTARRMLDLGCGLGSLGRWRPTGEVQVFGVDYNWSGLAEAKHWERVAQCDLEDERLPFAAQSFEAVLAKDILEHVRRPWKVVAEIRRVLAPGGRVLVSTPMPKPEVVWNDYTHIRGFTRLALRQMFEDNGFEVVQLIRMGSLRGAGRLRLVNVLPAIMNLPILGPLLAINHELLARRTT